MDDLQLRFYKSQAQLEQTETMHADVLQQLVRYVSVTFEHCCQEDARQEIADLKAQLANANTQSQVLFVRPFQRQPQVHQAMRAAVVSVEPTQRGQSDTLSVSERLLQAKHDFVRMDQEAKASWIAAGRPYDSLHRVHSQSLGV